MQNVDLSIQLTDWGFRWTLGTKRPKRTEPKPWDERLAELVTYKEEHGDCLVQQNYPGGLGSFVHKQRTEYKKFLDGRKTVMTREKFEKLTEIEFVFEQRKRGGNTKPSGKDDASDEEDDDDDDEELHDVNEGRNARKSNEYVPWDRYSTGARQR
jgi:hypothetical protein